MKLSATKWAALSLYGVQVSNLVIPLITLPWLALSLGSEKFGLYNFVFAATSYLTVLVDYGFNLTATRDVAMCSDDMRRRSEIFWTTLIAKGILGLICAVVLIFVLSAVERIGADRPLYVLAFGGVVISILNTTWLFQGLGKLATAAFANVVTRVLSLPLLFVFVQDPADIETAMVLNLAPGVIAALFCLFVLKRNGLVAGTYWTWPGVAHSFSSGFQAFVTSGLSIVYSSSYQIAIGLLLNNSAVAVYVVADKISKAFQALLTPLSTAIYHDISRLLSVGDIQIRTLLRNALIINVTLGVIFWAAIVLAAAHIIQRFFSQEYLDSVLMLRILAVVPLCIGVQHLSYMLLLGLKKEAWMSKIILVILLFHVPFLYVMISKFHLTGATIATVAAELLITLSVTIISRRELQARALKCEKVT